MLGAKIDRNIGHRGGTEYYLSTSMETALPPPQRSVNQLAQVDKELDVRPTQPYADGMDYQHLITIDPAKRGGKPCIRGLRMTVADVLDYLASGMSQEDILRDFPDLTAEDIRACLAFAADRERRLLSIPAA